MHLNSSQEVGQVVDKPSCRLSFADTIHTANVRTANITEIYTGHLISLQNKQCSRTPRSARSLDMFSARLSKSIHIASEGEEDHGSHQNLGQAGLQLFPEPREFSTRSYALYIHMYMSSQAPWELEEK